MAEKRQMKPSDIETRLKQWLFHLKRFKVNDDTIAPDFLFDYGLPEEEVIELKNLLSEKPQEYFEKIDQVISDHDFLLNLLQKKSGGFSLVQAERCLKRFSCFRKSIDKKSEYLNDGTISVAERLKEVNLEFFFSAGLEEKHYHEMLKMWDSYVNKKDAEEGFFFYPFYTLIRQTMYQFTKMENLLDGKIREAKAIFQSSEKVKEEKEEKEEVTEEATDENSDSENETKRKNFQKLHMANLVCSEAGFFLNFDDDSSPKFISTCLSNAEKRRKSDNAKIKVEKFTFQLDPQANPKIESFQIKIVKRPKK